MSDANLFMSPDEFKQALRSTGLSQVEFAELCGVPLRTAAHWSTTRAPNVAATLIALLAERPELVSVLRQIAKRREAGRAHS